jgi:hypothetical protein
MPVMWWAGHITYAFLHIKTVTIETKKTNPLTSPTNLLAPELMCAALCLRLITSEARISSNYLINYVDQSPSWEADTSLAIHEVSHILWNP